MTTYVKYPKKGEVEARNDKFGEIGLVETSMIGKSGMIRGKG